MPAGRLLAGGELHGSLSVRQPHPEEPTAAAGRRLPVPGLQTQGIAPAHRPQTGPLHRPIHHLRRTLGTSLLPLRFTLYYVPLPQLSTENTLTNTEKKNRKGRIKTEKVVIC